MNVETKKICNEQFFWNNLKDEEVSRLEKINDSDETFDFSNFYIEENINDYEFVFDKPVKASELIKKL